MWYFAFIMASVLTLGTRYYKYYKVYIVNVSHYTALCNIFYNNKLHPYSSYDVSNLVNLCSSTVGCISYWDLGSKLRSQQVRMCARWTLWRMWAEVPVCVWVAGVWILANWGCDGQGATSQGHDLSARGLLRGQDGVKRPKANLSCPAVAVCLSGFNVDSETSWIRWCCFSFNFWCEFSFCFNI